MDEEERLDEEEPINEEEPMNEEERMDEEDLQNYNILINLINKTKYIIKNIQIQTPNIPSLPAISNNNDNNDIIAKIIEQSKLIIQGLQSENQTSLPPNISNNNDNNDIIVKIIEQSKLIIQDLQSENQTSLPPTISNNNDNNDIITPTSPTSPTTPTTTDIYDNLSPVSTSENQIKITETDGYLNNNNKPIDFVNKKTTIVTLKPNGEIIAY